MSAPYSSRASAIIATMRDVLPATSPTGKSNWAIAMRRVSVMSDSGDEHVERGHDGAALLGDIGNRLAQHAHGDAHDLRRVHHHGFAPHRHEGHQSLDHATGALRCDQRHDHPRARRLDQVTLHIQQIRNLLAGSSICIPVDEELAHSAVLALNARTWSLSMPSRSMRAL